MKDRGIQFFMLPDEFGILLADLLCVPEVVLLVRRDRDLVAARTVAQANQVFGPGPLQRRFFFACGPLPVELPSVADVNPGKLGWADGVAPRIDGKALLMAELGSKSEWVDWKTRQSHKSPASQAVYGKAHKLLKSRISFPVWAINITLKATARAYRTIGFSPGAAAWVSEGGTLKQEGVENVVFSTSTQLGS